MIRSINGTNALLLTKIHLIDAHVNPYRVSQVVSNQQFRQGDGPINTTQIK